MTLRTLIRATVLIALSTVAATLPSATSTTDARFSASSANGANALSALVVNPPTNVSSTLALNVLPLATCKATVTWTASGTAGVTGYSIQRVRSATGVVDGGPWTVGAGATSTVDAAFPLQLLSNSYAWQIRADRVTWSSAWVQTIPSNLALCLL